MTLLDLKIYRYIEKGSRWKSCFSSVYHLSYLYYTNGLIVVNWDCKLVLQYSAQTHHVFLNVENSSKKWSKHSRIQVLISTQVFPINCRLHFSSQAKEKLTVCSFQKRNLLHTWAHHSWSCCWSRAWQWIPGGKSQQPYFPFCIRSCVLFDRWHC